MKKGRISLVGVLPLLVMMTMGLGATREAVSQISVYGGFTASQFNNPPGKDYLYGATAGVFASMTSARRVALSADLRASYLHGADQTLTGLVLGPRLSFAAGKYTPSIEGLIGFGRYNDDLGATPIDTTDTLLEGSFALDRAMARRLDWRIIQASYSQFFDSNDRFHPLSLSTGLVFHFGAR